MSTFHDKTLRLVAGLRAGPHAAIVRPPRRPADGVRGRALRRARFGGHYVGPEEGFYDAVYVKFKDLEAYRTHMRVPRGPDEAAHLPQHIARIRAFDIITPAEPANTAEIIQLYKERWEMFRDARKVLREEVDAQRPYL
jgi:hypothetical protein